MCVLNVLGAGVECSISYPPYNPNPYPNPNPDPAQCSPPRARPSDPYVRVSLGKFLFSDRENAVDDATDVDLYKVRCYICI